MGYDSFGKNSSALSWPRAAANAAKLTFEIVAYGTPNSQYLDQMGYSIDSNFMKNC